MFEYEIYWCDDDQSILILEITAEKWDWSLCYRMMQEFKATAETVSHPIYTVLFFHDAPPTHSDIVPRVKKMLDLRPQNGILIVFVGTNSLFKAVVNGVGKSYMLKNIVIEFRFVTTVEQAIELIQAHKNK